MTIIAYKKPSSQIGASEVEWGAFLKQIESDLPQDAGRKKPLENVWQIPLDSGLPLLPLFHVRARSCGVRVGVLVSDAEDSTISIL